jgi:hypothetical protein
MPLMKRERERVCLFNNPAIQTAHVISAVLVSILLWTRRYNGRVSLPLAAAIIPLYITLSFIITIVQLANFTTIVQNKNK